MGELAIVIATPALFLAILALGLFLVCTHFARPRVPDASAQEKEKPAAKNPEEEFQRLAGCSEYYAGRNPGCLSATLRQMSCKIMEARACGNAEEARKIEGERNRLKELALHFQIPIHPSNWERSAMIYKPTIREVS